MANVDTDDEFEGELEHSQAETRASFENRALMYAYMYEELSDELGEERATELMRRAIHRRGLEVGRAYRAAAQAGDLEQVGQIFCEGSPCGGALFDPGVEDIDEDRVVLRMTSCPLMDAWRRAGFDPEECERLCFIAAAVDEGTFEGAGLQLEFLDRLGVPGSERCLLELRVPERG